MKLRKKRTGRHLQIQTIHHDIVMNKNKLGNSHKGTGMHLHVQTMSLNNKFERFETFNNDLQT